MSIDLDTRQRAMLQEMGVHVWLPETERPLPGLPQRALAHVTDVAPVLAPPVALVARTALGHAPSAGAIENIASNAIAAGVRVKKTSNNQTPGLPLAPAADLGGPPHTLAPGIAAMDWPRLAHTVAECQACALCSGRRAAVFAPGNSALPPPWQADWLVVGDPPDEAEERQGAPFADAVGQLLDNMLRAVGVSRPGALNPQAPMRASQCAYVSNVVKCRTDPARNPSAQELATCAHFLRREVALVQPKVILAMGRFAAQSLLHGSLPEGSKTPFGKLRGQVYRFEGIPVVVTYHPVYLLRTPLDKARAWADLCLAKAAASLGGIDT